MTELLIIENVRAVDPAASVDGIVDVVIERGKIVRIGPKAAPADISREHAVRIDGTGKLLLPAFVDLHAHFREPGQEYKEDIESGLAAAAAGGFAHVCAMPNTRPVNDKRSITEAMVARARDVGGPRLHPIGAITLGQLGKELTEMADLRDAGAVGVSDDGRCVMSAAVMKKALEYAKTFDMPVIQHAEDHTLTEGAQMHEGVVSTRLGLRGWPREAEDIIVARDVRLVESTGGRYHLAHVSTQGAVAIIRDAKHRGLPVTAEVTPHHLLLTHEAVIGYDTACKVNPPLREEEDVAALREALADGTIDAVATDHAPHSSLEKDCEFDEASPGMIGLELVVPTLLDLVDQGQIPLARLITALTTGPARIVGLSAPTLREGAAADMVLIDPTTPWSPKGLRSKSRNSPFLDRTWTRSVELTILGGRAVYRRDAVH